MAPIAAEREGREQGTVGIVVLDDVTVPRAAATRRRFLRAAVAAGGVLLAGGIAVTGLPGPAASAPSAEQDTRILNFALGLEYLEEAFYAAAATIAVGDDLRRYLDVVGRHETRHVEYLSALLGTEAVERPTFDFGTSLDDEDRVLRAAVTLEDLGVSAYNGQAPNLTSARIADVAKIVSVDARHAAWARALAGLPAAPAPVDTAFTADEVRAALRRAGLRT